MQQQSVIGPISNGDETKSTSSGLIELRLLSGCAGLRVSLAYDYARAFASDEPEIQFAIQRDFAIHLANA